MAERLANGRFLPGKSGNPGGQPSGMAEVKALARSHTKEAIQALASIATSKKAPPSARVSAAVALLDRGYGRPAQAVELSGPEGGAIPLDLGGLSEQQLDQLEDILATATREQLEAPDDAH